jgi:hypothetical protein
MSMDKQDFELWLDGIGLDGAGLDGESINSQNEQQWQQDETLAGDYETSLWLKHQAACFEQQAVPDWNREATFDYQQQPSNGRNWFSWLSISPNLSIAMSLAAILMVLFRVEIHFNDNGLLLTFASDSSKQMQTLVDDKFKDFGRDQQIIMANYVDDIQTEQRDNIAQLATYLVTSNREERQEEMGDLVHYLKTQRDDDLSLQQQQLTNVLYNLNPQPTSTGFKRVSYEPKAKAKVEAK